MAETKAPTSTAEKKETAPAERKPQGPAGFGAALPYIVAAIIMCGAMAWYFFLFVPSQIEYFVGLRFRTLAVAAGQVRSKIDNLQNALDSAILAIRPKDESPGLGLSESELDALRKYSRVLLPDIRFGDSSRSTFGFPFDNAVNAQVGWDSILSQARSISATDFDDLLLASNDGKVVWQREKTTTRVGNLNEILNSETAPEGWLPSLSWHVRTAVPKVVDKGQIPETAELKALNMNGRSSFVLIQGISLSTRPGKPMYLAGVLSQKDLQTQAMRIPIAWIVLISLPIVLLFLAFPFVKLATLTSKERYRYADVVFLCAATLIAAEIGTSLPFVPVFDSSTNDEQLTRFASRIESNFETETRRVINLATFIQNRKGELKLNDCDVELVRTGLPIKRCGLWEAIAAAKKDGDTVQPGSVELDVAVWIDDSGNQVQKWSTKRQVTAPASHQPFAHFRDLKYGHLWNLAGSTSGDGFTIDPIRSPTTSELAFNFAMRAALPGKDVPKTPVMEQNAFGFVLNVRPQAIVDPVIPPGYGFAIVAEDGRVLFHSNDGLSLEENFFDEVSNSSNVRREAQVNRVFTWTGEYHGRPHRLHMRPLAKIIGCPWRIVTFQAMEPWLGAQFQQQTDIFRLLGLHLLAIIAIIGIVALYCRMQGRELRDQIIHSFRATNTGHIDRIRGLVPLATFAVVVFMLSCTLPIPAFVDLLTAACGLLSLTAVALALTANARTHETVRAEIFLLLFLIGVAPAATFSAIVYRVNAISEAAVWLHDAEQEGASRQQHIQDRTIPALYSTNTRIVLNNESGFANADANSLSSYLPHTEQTTNAAAASLVAAFPEASLTVRLLRWSPFQRVKDEFLDASAFKTDARNLIYSASVLRKPIQTQLGQLTDDLSLMGIVVGVIVLASVLAALNFVVGKITAGAAFACLGLSDRIKKINQSPINEGLLLIGPPRSNKDARIEDETKPLRRIKLLDQELSDAFIKSTVNLFNAEARAAGKAERHWILLSNLEAQLTSNEARKQVLVLLERLLDHAKGDPAKGIAVSSTVDPIAHFKELFAEERKRIYTDAIPEVDLGRPSLILSRFHRCFVTLNADKADVTELWDSWLQYNPANWKRTAELEVGSTDVLKDIDKELEQVWGVGVPIALDELARAIQNRAQAYYELVWASCTRSEKLVLIQLAQEGFINPKSCDVLSQLVAKGLVVEAGSPTIFNYTFRRYLRDIERHSVVNEWEAMEGSGLWVMVGRVAASTLVVGAGFYLVTQDMSVQSLLPLISGSGFFGVPIIREFIARISTKPSTTATA